jgi:RimJ/RimL family protein N-acetyltransferase
MKISVRLARPEDAEKIFQIHLQAVEDRDAFVFEPDEFKGTAEGKRQQIERFSQSKNSCLLVAEVEDQIAGWISLSGHELKKLSHVAMLGTAVDRNFRGRGIGSALVSHAIQWAKTSSSLRRIALAVFESNTPAVAIYKKFGFEIEGIERNEIRFADGKFCNQIIMAQVW